MAQIKNKLWQLAERWLPPFYVPLEPGSQPAVRDYNRWPRIDFNIEGFVQRLWLASFGWLNLLVVTQPKRSAADVKHLRLPFTRQFATSVVMILLGVYGVMYFTFFAGTAQPVANQVAPPAPETVQAEPAGLSRSAPVGVRIPKIGVNAPTSVELGLHEDGTVETPKEYEIVGWYKYAPTPGQVGPAILIGHVDNYLGPAVFYRISELVPGDTIEVDRADGQTVTFQVQGLEQYPQSDFPTDKVYGNLDYAGLRLITCGGQFNRLTGRYSDNTVVYASIVES